LEQKREHFLFVFEDSLFYLGCYISVAANYCRRLRIEQLK